MITKQEIESLLELAVWSYYKDLPDDHVFDLNETEDWNAYKKYAAKLIVKYIREKK